MGYVPLKGLITVIDTVVILATGHPAHESKVDRPRAMLPAMGKPLVARVLDSFYQAGIRHFVLVVGINEGAVVSYLTKQWMPDVKFDLILQTESDDLMMCLSRVARQFNKPFALASYNQVTHGRFVVNLLHNHHHDLQPLVLVGSRSVLGTSALHYYAVIQEDNLITLTQDVVSDYILADYAICGQEFIDYLRDHPNPTRERFGQPFLEIVRDYFAKTEQGARFAETSWVLRIESDTDLLSFNRRLLEETNDSHILSELPYSVKVIAPVRIDPQVSVGQGAIIGPNVYLEKGASVGYGAVVRNAVVLARGTIAANTTVDGAIVTSRGLIK